jgi:hypothetical protein
MFAPQCRLVGSDWVGTGGAARICKDGHPYYGGSEFHHDKFTPKPALCELGAQSSSHPGRKGCCQHISA